MKSLLKVALVGSLGLISSGGGAFGVTSEYQLGFGPFAGSGDISTGAKVRNTSGYALTLERNWPITGGLSLGPRFEFANAFVTARDSDGGDKTVSTYDNRIVAAGLTLSQNVGNDHTFAQGVYVSAVAGKGYSKLSIDQSSDKTYKQSLRGNISGTYFGGEIGSWIPLKGSFGLNIAMLTSLYEADQSKSPGTFEGDQIGPEGNLELTKGKYDENDGTLEKKVNMRTFAAKVGLSLGF